MTPQIHHVAGRLRVRVRAIKGSREHAAHVKDLLQAVEGVTAADPNLATGSVVIHYDPQSTGAALILRALTDRGYFETTPLAPLPPRKTVAVRIRNKIATAVFWYCLEIALERSLPLMLAALL
jgi:copper chaperone CopZ